MDHVEKLLERQTELAAANQKIFADANGKLTDEQRKIFDANEAEIAALEGDVTRAKAAAERVAKLQNGAGRKTEPARITSPVKNPADEKTFGFESFGAFARVVANASRGLGGDVRLDRFKAASLSTYGSEGVGADGGFAVPPEYSAEIARLIGGQSSLYQLTDRQTTASNQVVIPVDQTSDWQTSGGIQAYWESEASAIAQSKPSFENRSVRLHKLAALVPVTDEMLEDAPGIDSYLRSKVPAKMDFKLSHAIVWGTGAGQPQGIQNAASLVSVAKESGQTADTINATNVLKMYARMPADGLANAVWLIHPDALPQLPLMTIGNFPAYVPPGGMTGNVFGTLLGRPVIPHQVCETVGDLGDIMFVDFSKYLTVTKSTGVVAETSMHLWFDQNATAFRFTMRVAGQPWLSSTITQRDGSNAQSYYVTLAERA